jgi:hypothetical protein
MDRLSSGPLKRPCIAEDETTLAGAAHAYAVPLAALVREVLDGRLSLQGRLEMDGALRGLVVQRAEVLTARRRLRAVRPQILAALAT